MKYNEALLTVRQNLISAFKRYEYLILPFLRFILSFSALRMLKSATSYEGVLGGVISLLGISLIGAFTSAECIEVCTIFIVCIFVAAYNPILAILLLLTLCGIYILFGRLFPKESLLIIVTLIAFSIKMELAVPIIAALIGSYACVIAILIGIGLWYIIPKLSVILAGASLKKDQLIDTLTKILSIDYKELVANQTMLIMIIVFFTVFTAIYIIRKQAIDYGPYIAIAVGAVMGIMGFCMANIFFVDTDINLIIVIVEMIIFSLVAVIVQFLAIVLDYQRAEVVSFEDDDNFYYVKIIPKIHMNFKHKKVKKIYTGASQNNRFDRSVIEDDDFTNGF